MIVVRYRFNRMYQSWYCTNKSNEFKIFNILKFRIFPVWVNWKIGKVYGMKIKFSFFTPKAHKFQLKLYSQCSTFYNQANLIRFSCSKCLQDKMDCHDLDCYRYLHHHISFQIIFRPEYCYCFFLVKKAHLNCF